jgi:penicillin-binding protein 2
LGKRDPRDERLGRARHKWLITLVIVLFSILTVRLFGLQYVRHDHYSQYAEENQLQRERIISPRGLIKDRNGNVLVDNVPSFDIVLPWRTEADVRDTIDSLFAYIPLDTSEIYSRFSSWQRRNRGLPFPMVQNANKAVISFVRENYDLFPKLRVEANARRRYVNGGFAAHLLGYVGEVSDQFLAQRTNDGYFPGDLTGKTGIEGVCEQYLRGEDGQRVVAVNASGTVLGELKELLKPPVPGKDVTLTIDARLQRHLEDQIAPLGAGAAVVMDVDDGSLLAVVSIPQFDPNSFALGIDQAEWDRLNGAEDKPLFNRFLQATYPPASTLKIVAAYTLLTQQLVNPQESIVYCTGAYRFGNRIYRCWKHGGHGYMNLHEGFVQSCDSYFYRTAEIMDVDELATASRQFGLGSRTGIDMPNEIPGLVPDRAYYNKRYGKGKWTQGLVLNNVIGQGEYLTSVLQMCRVAAAVANGGYLVQPHVMKSVQGEPAGVYGRKRVKSLEGYTLTYLRRVMKGVVHGEHGTGRASRLAGLKSAGKTGTAQNPHGEDHAWFVSYAPADDPEIAVAIIVENSGHGGAVSAPIARSLYSQYFAPDDSTAVLSRGNPTGPERVGGDQ